MCTLYDQCSLWNGVMCIYVWILPLKWTDVIDVVRISPLRLGGNRQLCAAPLFGSPRVLVPESWLPEHKRMKLWQKLQLYHMLFMNIYHWQKNIFLKSVYVFAFDAMINISSYAAAIYTCVTSNCSSSEHICDIILYCKAITMTSLRKGWQLQSIAVE